MTAMQYVLFRWITGIQYLKIIFVFHLCGQVVKWYTLDREIFVKTTPVFLYNYVAFRKSLNLFSGLFKET